MGSKEWEELTGNYPIHSTPSNLIDAINGNSSAWFCHGYTMRINSIKTEDGMIIVNTEKCGASGYAAGGIFYVNESNKQQCVEDF